MTEITLRVEPNIHAPRISRSYLTGVKPDLEPRFEDVAVVVSELVTNSVRYANGPSEIDVLIAASQDRIRIEVSDGGPCFDKEMPRHGGMGLDIVDQIAARWGVETQSKCTVWVEISKNV